MPDAPATSLRTCAGCLVSTGTLLDSVSALADVNYYRCGRCDQVFFVPKDDPAAPPARLVGGRPRGWPPESAGHNTRATLDRPRVANDD